LAVWEIIFMLVILKIPVVYVGWVIWWAVKAEPEVGTQGGTEGVNWKPWLPQGSPSRHRDGPHGTPGDRATRGPARPERRRDRISA